MLRPASCVARDHQPKGKRSISSRHAVSDDIRVTALDVLILAVVALAVRLVAIDHPPNIDEFHHILAARSLITNGTLEVGEGMPYTRARAFTYLVAAMFGLFGESFVAARLPAVLAGAALVVAGYLWVRGVAGRGAGWAAGLLLTFDPTAIRLSEFSRFYTLHALTFWVSATATYRVVAKQTNSRQRLGYALLAVAALGFAIDLQIITVVGAAGLALWIMAASGPQISRWVAAGPGRRWIVGAALLLGTAALVWFVGSGNAARMVTLFRYADLWAVESRTNLKYYHWILMSQYATLWTLFPLSLLLIASRNLPAALFCGLIFGTAFIIHSFAAWKDIRYLFYVLPMFFAASGMAIAMVLAALRDRLHTLLGSWQGHHLNAQRVRIATAATLLLAVLFAAAGNGAVPQSLRIITGEQYQEAGTAAADYAAAAVPLRPIADSSSILVSSSALKALYFFGRVDFSLLATDMYRRTGGQEAEFAISQDFARPMISKRESLQLVMACHPSGLVLVENSQWREPWGVPPETADYLEAHAERLPLPKEHRLLAFRWREPVAAEHGDCPPRGEK